MVTVRRGDAFSRAWGLGYLRAAAPLANTPTTSSKVFKNLAVLRYLWCIIRKIRGRLQNQISGKVGFCNTLLKVWTQPIKLHIGPKRPESIELKIRPQYFDLV
jgi:hypothetical protein